MPSPLPWKQEGCYVHDANGAIVCATYSKSLEEDLDNAALIVAAVNGGLTTLLQSIGPEIMKAAMAEVLRSYLKEYSAKIPD